MLLKLRKMMQTQKKNHIQSQKQNYQSKMKHVHKMKKNKTKHRQKRNIIKSSNILGLVKNAYKSIDKLKSLCAQVMDSSATYIQFIRRKHYDLLILAALLHITREYNIKRHT